MIIQDRNLVLGPSEPSWAGAKSGVPQDESKGQKKDGKMKEGERKNNGNKGWKTGGRKRAEKEDEHKQQSGRGRHGEIGGEGGARRKGKKAEGRDVLTVGMRPPFILNTQAL